jgi:hypothetical protein
MNSLRNARTHNESDPNLQMFYRAVRESPIAINFPPHVAPLLAESGRFKNELETGTTMGAGSRDTERRLDVEKDVLGIPHHVPPEERPIYGGINLRYLLRNKEIAQQIKSQSPQLYLPRQIGVSELYGNAWAELHPHVNERSTLTPDDTFNVTDRDVVPAKNRHTVFNMQEEPVHTKQAQIINDTLHMKGYVEAQIHGGVDFGKDVHSLHIQLHPAGQHPNVTEVEMKDPETYNGYIEKIKSSDAGVKDLLPLAQKYKLPLHMHWVDKEGNNYEHVIHPQETE